MLSALLPILLLFAPQPRPTEKCSLSGVAVDSITGDPLNKVNISLEALDGAASVVAVTISDPKGRFGLVDLDPGVYRLKADRSGYLEMSYGARRAGADGSRLRLEPGRSLNDINIKLTPGAAISGTVRDGDGEPLEGAHVVLARFNYSNRIPVVRRDASTETDERGEYRFHGLAAGKYFIGVEPRIAGLGRVDHSGSPAPTEMPIPTLYPAANDVSLAAPIEALAGRRIAGIDVTLIRSSVFRVSGRILNPPSGRPVTLELRDTKNGGVRDRPARISTKNASGDFEFRGVPPGSYYLGTVADSLGCNTLVVVGAADIEGLQVTLSAGATIERLRVATEGDEKANLSDLNIQLAANEVSESVSSSFGRGGVRPGHYSVTRFYGSPIRQYYVKAARAGETDLLADGLTIPAGGSIQIAITLAADGAKVEGAVRNAKELPAPGATVVLVPESRSRAYLFQSTTSDQNGRYEFPAVQPGDYKVFAWDDVEPEIWNDPDFLKKYEKQGQKTALEAKGRKVVDVRIAVQADPE